MATRKVVVLLGILATVFARMASGQSMPSASVDPDALVRRAVQHGLDANKNHRPVQYLLRKIDDRHDISKVIVETKDGDVARLVAVNGQPLSADVNQAELARLDDLATHPELQEHRKKSEQKDTERATHLLSLLPDAFLYRLEGMVPCATGECYRLSFMPNPHFTPPDIEAGVFRGIAGEMWIDQAQEQLTRMDAHFISDVDFGFGILGKLNKGGTALLEQTDIGEHNWKLTGLTLHVNGKALLVRTLSFQTKEEMSHFVPAAPGLDYRGAIRLLKQYAP